MVKKSSFVTEVASSCMSLLHFAHNFVKKHFSFVSFFISVCSDSVTYGKTYPWPTLANGFGCSLERLCLDAPGDNAGNWAASVVPQYYPSVLFYVYCEFLTFLCAEDSGLDDFEQKVRFDTRFDVSGTPGRRSTWQSCPPFVHTSVNTMALFISEILFAPSVLCGSLFQTLIETAANNQN